MNTRFRAVTLQQYLSVEFFSKMFNLNIFMKILLDKSNR